MRVTFEADERPQLIARLGLPDTATDAEINSGLVTLLAESSDPAEPQPAEPRPGEGTNPPSTPGPTEPGGDPGSQGVGGNPPDPSQADPSADDDDDGDDTVTVDAAAWRRTQERANLSARLIEEERVSTRDRLIEDAIRAGKFGPSRREHYRNRFDDDPDGVTGRINRMLPDVVPLEERGVEPSDDELEANSDAYPTEWVPEQNRPGARSVEKSTRIHGEE